MDGAIRHKGLMDLELGSGGDQPCTAEFHTQTSLDLEDSIDTLIDVLNTQACA